MYVSVKADTERGKKQTLSWAFCLRLFLCSGIYFLNRYPFFYRGFFLFQSCISLDFAPSPWANSDHPNKYVHTANQEATDTLHTMIPKPSVSGSAHSKSLRLLPPWRAGIPWHETSTPRATSTPPVPTVLWPRRGVVMPRTASGRTLLMLPPPTSYLYCYGNRPKQRVNTRTMVKEDFNFRPRWNVTGFWTLAALSGACVCSPMQRAGLRSPGNTSPSLLPSRITARRSV